MQDRAPREERDINWGERRGPMQDRAPREERDLNWGERRGPIHEKPQREEREINWGERRGPLVEKKRAPRAARHEKPEDEIPNDDWRSAGPRAAKGKKSDNASATQSESSSSSKNVDEVKKSFGVLNLDDEPVEAAVVSDKAAPKKQENLTAAEKILAAEAPKEELEADGWNVVPAKKAGRK